MMVTLKSNYEIIMKRFNTLLLGFVSLAVLASCQGLNTLPKFEESESFASFTKAAFALNEDKGQVIIPVEIASLAPVKTTVSYKINEGTAKAGVNYKDTNPDAVLTYDGSTRSQNIVIDIINLAGEYTGDLKFSISLESATGLKLSAEKECTVTIYDLDHPLSAILGTYTGSAMDVGGEVTWTLNLTKDPSDVTILWCDALCPLQGSTASLLPVYANVTQDEATGLYQISFPGGQEIGEYSGEGVMKLVECYIEGGNYMIDSGVNIVYDQTPTGFESLQGVGFVNNYLWYNAFLLGDRTQAGYKVVWTKVD